MTREPYVFQAADGQKTEAERGRLLVPENRSSSRTNSIELAFVRFKSTAAEPGLPIIYLAGGPGGSGIATAGGPRFPQFMAMRAVADVIALDQRGVGQSKPNLECRQTLDYPPDRPGDREEMLRLYRERSRACARFWTEQGVDLFAYNTIENADDVDALREALGMEKISLWATSYGTHLALTVIRRHEEHIHRAVLAGVEGPDHTLKMPGDVQRHFEELARLYREDPEVGHFLPDLLEWVDRVCARLEKEPVAVVITDPQTGERINVTVGSFDLQLFAAALPGRIQAIQNFPAAAHAISNGDFTPLATFALEFRRAPLPPAMSLMMDCASGASEGRWARFRQEAAAFPLASLADFPYPDICDAWGSPDLGPAFRSPIRAHLPVLFMSGALDGRTPANNVEEIRDEFPNSVHVLIEGTAHGDHLLLSTPLTGQVMMEFLSGRPVSTTRITLPPPRLETGTSRPDDL